MRGFSLVAFTLPFLPGIDVTAAEPEWKPDELPVFIERNTTVTAYALFPKVGDQGARIFGSSRFVDPWIVLPIESGEIFERQTWVSRFDWKNRRQSQTTAIFFLCWVFLAMDEARRERDRPGGLPSN